MDSYPQMQPQPALIRHNQNEIRIGDIIHPSADRGATEQNQADELHAAICA